MTSLNDMAKKLQPMLPTAKVVKENHDIPDLESVASTLHDRCLSQSIPDAGVCTQIADVLYNLAAAHKAYGQAAEGLANLASQVTPEQYSVLLAASAMPAIQVVISGQMAGPLTHQIQHEETSPAVTHAEIIKFTKTQVLPNPSSPALAQADKN